MSLIHHAAHDNQYASLSLSTYVTSITTCNLARKIIERRGFELNRLGIAAARFLGGLELDQEF